MKNVLKQRLAEILSRAGLRLPKTLTVSITGTCNLACRHCLVDAGDCDSGRHVDAGLVSRVVEEFATIGEGIRFTGGEPLCHPEWFRFLRLARKLDFFNVSLQTNAMLFTPALAAQLAELDFEGLKIQVSVDGAGRKSHDLVRGSGAFDEMLRGVSFLAEEGLAPRITFFLTEMRHNLHEIPELLELAERLGIGSVVTGALVRGGRAASDSSIAPPQPEQYLLLLDRFNKEPHFRDRYERLGNVAFFEWQKGSPRTESCTFIENPYLASSGRLYPCVLCHADPYSVSSVFEKGLERALVEGAPLWSQLQKISDGRAREIEKCSSCGLRHSCGGGCMGRAWGSSEDMLAPDDRCGCRSLVQ